MRDPFSKPSLTIGDVIKIIWGADNRVTIARVITRGLTMGNWSWQFESCGDHYRILDKEMTPRVDGKSIYVSKLLTKEMSRR
jgi:hypothetical protein